MTPLKTWLGYPCSLGATWMDNDVNFAIFSAHAAGVELCLFDHADADRETIRIPMREQTNQIWHIFLFEFTRKLIGPRRDHPIFRQPKFFQGRKIRGGDVKDVMWFDPNGEEMNDEAWNTAHAKCLGMLRSGDAIDVRTFHDEPIHDRTYLPPSQRTPRDGQLHAART